MPVPDPTIAIRFTGLLAFCFDKRRKCCQIGAISKDHELRLRMVRRGPDPKKASEQTLTIPHGLIPESSDLWLDVEEGGHSPKQRMAEPFIAGSRDEPPTDPQDFRWVLDLEGEHFYNRPLKVRRDVLRPVLSVATGLFYTAALTSDSYRTIPVDTDGAPRKTSAGRNLGQIAEYVGANIYLTRPNQALVLRAGRNGPELLRLKRDEGTTYEITVENGDTPQAPAASDFHYYYDALKLNRDEPKILIEPLGLPAMRGSYIPCMPVDFGMSDGFGFD